MTETIITNPAERPGRRLRFTLGIKLAFIVALIVLGSIWAMTSLMSLMVSSQLARTAEDNNFAFNSRAAAGIEERLYRARSEALSLLDMDTTVRGINPGMALRLRNIFFERNPYIAAVVIPGTQTIVNQRFFINNEIPDNFPASWLENESAARKSAENNVPVLRNVTRDLNVNLLALFYPWQGKGLKESVVIFFSPQNISEIISTGTNSTMVVNGDGDILIHPDFSRILAGDNVSASLYFTALSKEPGGSVRLVYTESGNRYIAAGHRISIADAAVFSTLEYTMISNQLAAISRRNIMLSMTVLFLTILVTWFYAKSITTPLKKLIKAAEHLKTGDFYLDLKQKSSDEIGELTGQFISMGEGLSRYEEARDLVGHFNNRETVIKAMRGELVLHGEYLQAVVLSVDFISFPDITENMKPRDSLELLNSFFAKTINCIERSGGVTDKITGSRIIALWGIPYQNTDLAASVMKCMESVLLMRKYIAETNSGREESGLPPIRMSCGVHSGRVLAGSMGALNYNKYSVIGENVNAAEKCGELCGAAGVDIMITGAVRDLAAGRILAEEILPDEALTVSGREIDVFALVNLTPASDEEKQKAPATLDEVRDLLKPDTKKTGERKKK